MELKPHVDALRKELKEDADLYYTWQSNIAMAFKDRFEKENIHFDFKIIHEVANDAAKNFLNQLINIP